VSALSETVKVSAFLRRDLRIMLSYRMAAVGELAGIAGQAIAFSFVARLIDPSRLPVYGGAHADYLEFVVIGIAMNMVVILMLHQLATAIRNEQLAGTLESLLVTPTRLATIQTGSAAFQLLFVPIRMGFFVGVLGIVFGLHYHLSGVLPAIVILLGFLPFLWGLGLLSAGAILTFKRGNGVLMTGGTVLALASGALFPLALLPVWVRAISHANPLAIAIGGTREALIGGTAWTSVGTDLLELVPLAIVALALGALAFRLALRRERRLGTLGLY
jgi:ABC-2 type transport system permease protein